MSRITRILNYLHSEPALDQAFENYYSALSRVHPESAPSADEARRDFDRATRSMRRVFYY